MKYPVIANPGKAGTLYRERQHNVRCAALQGERNDTAADAGNGFYKK